MIHHVQLACPPGSEQALREFYGSVLGLDEIPKPPALAARGGCWFGGHGMELHLGVEKDFRPARKAHPGLLVTGLDAWARRLRDAGYPVQFDDGFPGMRRFYSQDPNGNRLEFLEPIPARRPGRPPAAEDPRFPSLADFREQAGVLAEAGADLIALEMIDGQGYGRAALRAAAETGLPVWLGVSPDRRDDGTLGTLPELGDGDSLDDLLAALADPSLAAVTVMHADPGLTLDAIDTIRRHYAGPVGVYAETGDWQPPNWVFDGLTPGEYLQQAITWAGHGARLVGGCCGTGPGHIRALADGLDRGAAAR